MTEPLRCKYCDGQLEMSWFRETEFFVLRCKDCGRITEVY